MTRRARSVALLGVAAACAGLAASLVNGYANDVRAQVGPLVPVVVARVDIPRGKLLTAGDAAGFVTERRVPHRFAPPGALGRIADAIGQRTIVPIASGGYVVQALLRPPGAGSRVVTPDSHSRIVEISVAGAGALLGSLRAGSRVDVLVTSEHGGGSPRTYLALQRAELSDLRPAEGDETAGGGSDASRADAIAALRVTLRQAVLLTAAQNFARELRLVPRPDGDRRLLGATSVVADQLRP